MSGLMCLVVGKGGPASGQGLPRTRKFWPAWLVVDVCCLLLSRIRPHSTRRTGAAWFNRQNHLQAECDSISSDGNATRSTPANKANRGSGTRRRRPSRCHCRKHVASTPHMTARPRPLDAASLHPQVMQRGFNCFTQVSGRAASRYAKKDRLTLSVTLN